MEGIGHEGSFATVCLRYVCPEVSTDFLFVERKLSVYECRICPNKFDLHLLKGEKKERKCQNLSLYTKPM